MMPACTRRAIVTRCWPCARALLQIGQAGRKKWELVLSAPSLRGLRVCTHMSSILCEQHLSSSHLKPLPHASESLDPFAAL
jgi:hypothetical protein